ncbi:MAG: sigma-70 family RNA polymerase sigma factor [Spirochaetia bacterium]|nr:sigma-70 family RNA polymerase sigma factor [Spirochaetia bacterium]
MSDVSIEKEWEAIYRENSSMLYGYLVKKTGFDQASDILQESFLKLLQSMKKNRKIENPKAYLFQTARNIISTEYNKNYLAVSTELSVNYEDKKVNVETQMLKKEVNNLIETAKHLLSKSELDLFELRWYMGFTQVEIAVIMEKSERQIRRDIEKIGVKIRNVFNDNGWGADDMEGIEL